jgi:predicted phage terminase large subunit-like protein
MDLLETVRAEKARRRLHEFVKQSWHIVEPGMPFVDNWHVGAICEHLEAISRGEIQKLLINIPPGHAKSLLVSVFWPAWQWINRPSWRALFSSYAIDLAIRDSVRTRTLIESSWYRSNFSLCKVCGAFPDPEHPTEHSATCLGWALSSDQNVKSNFKNTRTGERMSLSVGSKATGFRGDATVVDDPLNAIDARSELKRQEAIYWWDRVMSSRLNDQRKGARVIIMQRLHEEDLSGHVLDLGGYEHLCMPSLFEPSRRSITFIKQHEVETCELRQEDPNDTKPAEYEVDTEDDSPPVLISETQVTCSCPRHQFWLDPRQREGELLFKRLFPGVVLAEAKASLKNDFAGQHQQRPAPEDGQMFKKGWWRFYKPDGVSAEQGGYRPHGCYTGPAVVRPAVFDRVVLSLDAAFKDLETSDYVVFQVWGCKLADRYLLDLSRKQRGITDTIAEFKRLTKKWPHAQRKYVEDKANGTAVIEMLQRKIAGIIAIEPKGGKEARAAACTAEIESGNVFLPEGASWLDDFMAEFTTFPNGKHDDQVDCLSQALNELAGRSGAARARAMVNM